MSTDHNIGMFIGFGFLELIHIHNYYIYIYIDGAWPPDIYIYISSQVLSTQIRWSASHCPAGGAEFDGSARAPDEMG